MRKTFFILITFLCISSFIHSKEYVYYDDLRIKLLVYDDIKSTITHRGESYRVEKNERDNNLVVFHCMKGKDEKVKFELLKIENYYKLSVYKQTIDRKWGNPDVYKIINIDICSSKTGISVSEYFIYGVNAERDEKFDKAISYYKEALSLDPDHYWSNNNIGYVYYIIKEFYASINYSNKAISIDPENPFPYGALGRCFVELGKYDEALAYCQMAIEKMEKYNKIASPEHLYDNSEPYFVMAFAYDRLKDYEKSILCMSESARLGNVDAKEKLNKLKNNNSSQQEANPNSNSLKKDKNFKIE